MNPDDPFASVEVLSGVGPKTGARLREAGFSRIIDLALLLPNRYQERRRLSSFADAPRDGTLCIVTVEVEGVSFRWLRRRGRSMVTARLRTASGEAARAMWFNVPWVKDRLEIGSSVVLEGALKSGSDNPPEILNPRLHDPESGGPDEGLVPVYPPVVGFGRSRLAALAGAAVERLIGLEDPLGREDLESLGLPPLYESLSRLHRPEGSVGPELAGAYFERRTPWHRRLVFDEVLLLSASAARRRARRRSRPAAVCCSSAPPLERLAAALPFSLTAAQQRVVEEIAADLRGPGPMARLLQGDVGSGKTAVAGLAASIVIGCGRQAALMAPTEVLAQQHVASLKRDLGEAGLEPVLLTGSQTGRERAQTLEAVASGAAKMIVGTHALFQEGVRFAGLGLAIVDEQHRFGVLQRRALWEKGSSPHLLIMTATPIPRSLAQTLYGDLDLSVLDELPPGRIPVRTFVRGEESRARVMDFLERELEEGGRVFVVFPRIEESGDGATPALESALPEFEGRLGRFGVAAAHGRMESASRDNALSAFRAGSARVLLATTVVEVGVDVPEANVMVIEGAQRFGLSQLHQLRGRVGRGSSGPPWCILMASEGSAPVSIERLEVLAGTVDGFEVAEKDLELRGPGELEGLRQWGAAGSQAPDIARHADLIPSAARFAERLSRADRLETVLAALHNIHRGPTESEQE